ncbi:BrnA antitoxin family protein [Desulfovibrio inopinatus]|uniref:BrnA antitoxin family protein n=1 Tax=Desulfovibrio inopinatus TaxID=102109 RepID=UPI0005595135|nr:BrnA antitoxin family protein [Desulfovibrio inopinatus]
MRTSSFDTWLTRLRDRRAAMRIEARLDRDVLTWFRTKKKKGYQTAINAVLKAFVESQEQGKA